MLSVALTPDGRWVLSSSKDRGVQFWDPQNSNTQLRLQGDQNSDEPAARGCARAVRSTSQDSQAADQGFDHHDGIAVTSVATSPMGTLFVPSSGDMLAKIWRSVSPVISVIS